MPPQDGYKKQFLI